MQVCMSLASSQPRFTGDASFACRTRRQRWLFDRPRKSGVNMRSHLNSVPDRLYRLKFLVGMTKSGSTRSRSFLLQA